MLVTKQPTSNTTPDPAQGGSAVTTPANDGHASTTVSQAALGTSTKSCLWTALQAIGGQVLSMTLKFDWSEDGTVVVGSGSAGNSFRVEYSLNGGGAWNNIFTHADVASPTTSSSSVSLPLTQDTALIQVRDRLTATATNDASDSASITASISNIKVEITIVDGAVSCMM